MRSKIRLLLLACVGLWCAPGCGGSLRPLQAPAVEERAPQALVVNLLASQLGTPEIALCQRALRTADSEHLQAVIFDIGFAHGLGESQADVAALMDRVLATRTPTIAYVHGHVIEGAAYLALMCDQLYLDDRPDTDFGSVYHSEWKLEDLFSASPEEAERKRLESFRRELVQRLEQRKQKLSPDALLLCQGMADPTLKLVRATVRIGGVEQQRIYEAKDLANLPAQGITVIAQTEVTRPVQLSAQEAVEAGISQGTIGSREQLITDHLNLKTSDVAELVMNWSETMVGWLELLRPGLLVLGFVLLILEVKTPGVGLPGLLGTVFLALALFYSYLVGLAEISEILLFFLGIASLAVEIFLLPGTVVFGATGFLCLVFALVLSQQSFVLPSNDSEQSILFHNLLHLTGMFVVVIALTMSMWRILPKIPGLNRLYLPAPEPTPADGVVGAGEREHRLALVGRTAAAATTLRPAGAIELDGERIDVVTQGEFVEPGRQVRVIAVHGNRVVVEPIDDGQRGSAGLVLLLAVVGMLLIAAEVFFVSFGVLFLLSASCLFGAVFLAFQDSIAFGSSVLLGEAVLVPVIVWLAFKLLPHTPFGRALLLEAPRAEEVRSAPVDLPGLVGRTGVAISTLRPAGYARIDDRKIDVVTRGEMIELGETVRVIAVHGNRVVVKRDDAAS